MDDLERSKKPPRGMTDVYTEDSGLPPPTNDDMGTLEKPKKKPKKYAKGGFVSAADGIAQRGKTKGRMC